MDSVEDLVRSYGPSWAKLVERTPGGAAIIGLGKLEGADRDLMLQAGAAAARMMSDPTLRPLLELLLDNTLRQPSWDPDRGLFDGVAHGFFREGSNAIVAQILALIRLAGDPQENPYVWNPNRSTSEPAPARGDATFFRDLTAGDAAAGDGG